MALALGYGLLFSTPLILFFLPCFYLIAVNIRSRLDMVPMFKSSKAQYPTHQPPEDNLVIDYSESGDSPEDSSNFHS